MALGTDELNRFAGLLKQHEGDLVETWSAQVATTLRGRLSHTELRRQIEELYRALRDALEAGADSVDHPAAAELRAVLADLSRSRARQGFTSTETAVSVFALKDVLVAVMDVQGSEAGVLRDFVAYSSLIDGLALFTFATYATAREQLIADQAEELLELATPVVRLWEGVVAVPLVGTLDSARAQVVMERLLDALVTTGSAHAIIDITGVPAVDTQVAQHLLKTVVAARLMGADCIISGIRPQIAQTIVALGIEFGDIATKASLADALRHVLRLTGVDTRRAARKDG
jgi:rsbT co-antagonist protein RsbR